MIYVVIDKAGNIAYKATWTVAEEVDQVLGELTADGPAPAQAHVCGEARVLL